MRIIVLVFTVMLAGCSFKVPQNQWQYKSTNAFASYTKNFLSANDVMAENDLQRAIENAKHSADLMQLAKIYLGECSLNIAIGKDDKCDSYTKISELVESRELQAYHKLITNSLEYKDIANLPTRYKEFGHYIQKKDFVAAKDTIQEMEVFSSILIASSIIKKHLDKDIIDFLIKKSSFYGYKKAVLYWLDERLKYTDDQKEYDNIKKKILIMSN